MDAQDVLNYQVLTNKFKLNNAHESNINSMARKNVDYMKA